MSKNRIFNIADAEERKQYYERCDKRRRNGSNLFIIGMAIIGLALYDITMGEFGITKVESYEKGLANGMLLREE